MLPGSKIKAILAMKALCDYGWAILDCGDGFVFLEKEDHIHGYRTITLKVDIDSAMWVVDRFTRSVKIEANTDSFEMIQPSRWTVRLGTDVTTYGSGIGRSLAEAIWRALWHSFCVEKPVPKWLQEQRELMRQMENE